MRADSNGTPLSEINVTPMVDIMLVLLIIFMVAAPMLQQGIHVTLPKASTASQVSSPEVVITLTREHVVYFNDQVMTLKALRRKLEGLKSQEPILIRADRNAYVNKLIELWDLCRDAGFREVHIATLSE